MSKLGGSAGRTGQLQGGRAGWAGSGGEAGAPLRKLPGVGPSWGSWARAPRGPGGGDSRSAVPERVPRGGSPRTSGPSGRPGCGGGPGPALAARPPGRPPSPPGWWGRRPARSRRPHSGGRGPCLSHRPCQTRWDGSPHPGGTQREGVGESPRRATSPGHLSGGGWYRVRSDDQEAKLFRQLET